MNKYYILEMVPIIDYDDGTELEIENIRNIFKLNSLRTPSIGLKMVRQGTTANPYIRVSVTINDKDKVIYGQEYGEYQIHVYKYSDNINNAVELNFYNSTVGGTNLNGRTFNLQENSRNYSMFIQKEDIDYSYNYYAQIVLMVDKQNKGEGSLVERTERYILSAINNSVDISIGSALFDYGVSGLEVRFYDSYYNIDLINNIEYSVFNISNNFNKSGSFEPTWTLINDEREGVSYYRTIAPIYFDESGVYTIKMNFYLDDVLAGQVDSSYIYRQQ